MRIFDEYELQSDNMGITRKDILLIHPPLWAEVSSLLRGHKFGNRENKDGRSIFGTMD